MDDRVVRHDCHHAPADALVTYTTDPLLPDHDPPVPPALSARYPVPQEEKRLARKESRLPQPSHNARLVDRAVSAAHAPAEVGLELRHRESVGY